MNALANAEGPYIIGSLLYNANEEVSECVRAKIPHMREARFSPHVAIGIIRKGRLCGGLVFHNYRPNVDIEVSGAFDDPSWCWPQLLRTLFRYPFVDLNCVRLTTITGRKNKAARKLDEGVGFRLEGVVRKAIDGKEDAMVYGMLREECKFLKGLNNG